MFMTIAIILSFGFYMPVVLWSNTLLIVGILMIPKALAYVWVVFMGYKEMKKLLNLHGNNSYITI